MLGLPVKDIALKLVADAGFDPHPADNVWRGRSGPLAIELEGDDVVTAVSVAAPPEAKFGKVIRLVLEGELEGDARKRVSDWITKVLARTAKSKRKTLDAGIVSGGVKVELRLLAGSLLVVTFRKS